jgi:hypothetical protein
MSRLTCSEFDRLLFERTAERPAADERLHAHAAACERCAVVWNEERALDAAIAAWMTDVPETDLTDRVLAGWRDERAAVSSPESPSKTRQKRIPVGNRHFALLAVVAAAALVLAVSLALQNPRRPPQDVTTTLPDAGTGGAVAKRQHPSPGQGVDELPVEQLVAGMRTRYSGAARRMTEITNGWKLSWPAVADVNIDLLPRTPATTVPGPRPQNQTGGGIGETLKPIGRDVGKAFSFLRDAVPGLDERRMRDKG